MGESEILMKNDVLDLTVTGGIECKRIASINLQNINIDIFKHEDILISVKDSKSSGIVTARLFFIEKGFDGKYHWNYTEEVKMFNTLLHGKIHLFLPMERIKLHTLLQFDNEDIDVSQFKEMLKYVEYLDEFVEL